MFFLLAASLISALRAEPLSHTDVRMSPVLAWGALAVWAVISAAIAGDVATARGVVALSGAMAAVLVVCRRTSGAQREVLAGAVVAVGALTALTGWIGVAWRVFPWGLEDQDLWRAATTIGYANAAAGVLTPLTLLALARLVSRPLAPLDVGVACLLMVGLGATLSRGGAVALAAGITVLTATLGVRPTLRVGAPPAVGAVIALAGLVPSMASSQPERPVLATAALVMGLLTAVSLSRMRPRVVAALLAVAATIPLLLVVAEDRGGSSIKAVSRARINLSSPDRADVARAALDLAGERPLTGTGPGRATLEWVEEDGVKVVSRYAHNEYLQVLAELGVVGLALVLMLLAALAQTLRRARAGAPSPQMWAGVVAASVALAVHSALDFLWHLPAVPLVGVLIIGTVTPTSFRDNHA